MILHYNYGVNSYSISVEWNTDTDCSAVVQNITRELMCKHSLGLASFLIPAKELDRLVDKLYERIYIYNDEHYALPYDPKDRKLFIQAFSEICDMMAVYIQADRSEEDRILSILFLSVLDKLQEITGIYLLDAAYRRKHRYRRVNFEEWAETTDESKMAYEFEDVLTQIMDVSSVLGLLTEKERRRFIEYSLLRRTFQEIADHEGVSKQSVEESVSTALKKLRSILGAK